MRIRKSLHAVYLKVSHKMSNETIGYIVCCYRNSVNNRLKVINQTVYPLYLKPTNKSMYLLVDKCKQ